MDVNGELGLKLKTTPYDGCGKCWVGMIRQSSTKETTDSPEKQEAFNEEEAARQGGHIIGWAVDLNVSGATDPFDRPEFGPWLKDENGPYDGIVTPAVDRIGRSVPETTGTAKFLTKAGRVIVTRGHGVWDLTKPRERQQFNFLAMIAEAELANIQERAADTRVYQRSIGRKTGRLVYPYYYVHNPYTLAVEAIEFDAALRDILEEVADRLLADTEHVITAQSEARRLSNMGVLTGDNWRRARRGKPIEAAAWTATSLKRILLSPATMGYYMVGTEAGLGRDGKPIQIAEALWSYAKHKALVDKYGPLRVRKTNAPRAPKGDYLLLTRCFCGECGYRLYNQAGNKLADGTYLPAYNCKARLKGFKGAENCDKGIYVDQAELDALAIGEFLTELGDLPLFVQAFDPGSDATAQLARVEKQLKRLRDDRLKGLYDSDDQAEWYQETFKALVQETETLKRLPQRAAGTYWRPTGRTVADEWDDAATHQERRELMAAYNFRVDVNPRDSDKRFVFTFADHRTAVDARIGSWKAYQRDMEIEAEYLATIAAEQAATEGLEITETTGYLIPNPDEQAAGLCAVEDDGTRVLELIG
jgi:DNA invertase Pin-like site-specific DNA recombinase